MLTDGERNKRNAYMREYTRINKDHIIPISKGGSSRYDNLQVVPAVWNQQKGNKHASRFFGA